MNKLSNKTKGIFCILFSALCFSGMSSFINLSGDVPVPQKVFFRNLVALFFASAVLIKNHEPFKPTKGCLKYHFLRSSVGLLGVFGNFYATTHMAHTQMRQCSTNFRRLQHFCFLQFFSGKRLNQSKQSQLLLPLSEQCLLSSRQCLILS